MRIYFGEFEGFYFCKNEQEFDLKGFIFSFVMCLKKFFLYLYLNMDAFGVLGIYNILNYVMKLYCEYVINLEQVLIFNKNFKIWFIVNKL